MSEPTCVEEPPVLGQESEEMESEVHDNKDNADAQLQSAVDLDREQEAEEKDTESNENIGEDSGKKDGDLDEYNYTKRDEFTSEIFKLSISNLPKKFGFVVYYSYWLFTYTYLEAIYHHE